MIDWQTEDDEVDWLAEPEETAVSPHRKWGWLIAVLLFVGGATWFGFQVAERVQTNLQLARDVVRQQHLLTLSAAVEDDADLFNHIIGGSNLEWRVLQQLLLEENLLMNKAPLNLWYSTNFPVNELETAVQLSSDLTQATVQTVAPYEALQPNGRFETIWLRHENRYKLRNDVWHQTPFDVEADFWGEMLVFHGEQFEILYPARDKGIARRLAQDLDNLAVLVCNDAQFNCADNAEYHLLFDAKQTAVYRLSDNVRTKDIVQYLLIDVPVYSVKLPTPTLIGYPMNESSYQALYRGYAALFLVQLMNNLPTQAPLTHQMVIENLGELGLIMPPISTFNPMQVSEPPVALPARSLLLTCVEGNEPASWLYSPESDQWTHVGQPFERFTSARHILKPGDFQFPENVENQLLTAVPVELRPLSLEILTYATENGQTVVVAQVSKAHPDQFVFLYDGSEFVFIETVRKRGNSPMPVTFVGNSRYLSLTNYTYERSSITLIDLQALLPNTRYTIDGTPFEKYSWADETWFVLINDRELRLVAPSFGYEKVVYHNQAGCLMGQWAN
ncbi:MAG: hypothetical protein AAF490_15185 [Chloroflexota bacterium]